MQGRGFKRLALAVMAAGVMWTGWNGGTAAKADATIYRDPNFRGPAVNVSRADPNMRLNFHVFSIRVSEGWELCPEPNFRGQCLIVGQDTADLRRAYQWPGRLQSMRPLNDGPPGLRPPGGGQPAREQSLRGMAAEFFPAPRNRYSRVEACRQTNANAACAQRTADQFCSSRGWRRAANQMLQTENRTVYLADVLCVNN